MEITFLGTSAMQPTKERNLSSVLFNYNSENILVDCGEGTQRQMKIAGLKPTRINRILISHWHGDHVLGLGGLIRYLGANEYNNTLYIYGPKGIKEYIKNILNSCVFTENVKIELIELKEGLIFENKEFYIESFRLYHTEVCYGFNFIEKDKRRINVKYLAKFGLKTHPLVGELQRGKDIVWEKKKIKAKDATITVKGKKISFIIDTGFDKSISKSVKESDLVICEATYSDDLKEKAMKYKHLTAKQAAEIAKQAKAKKLILTHFSQRYPDIKELEKESKKLFKNTTCAKDFMKIVL